MKFGYVSWLPETELMAKFTEELKNNKLMGARCKRCGAKHLPPRAHCKCGSDEMEWFEAPRQGKILTYTLVTYPPESMSKYAPYIVAVAELEDGSRLLAQLTGVTPKSLRAGMPIQVVSHQVSEDRITYKFKPL
ncbi:MAG: hypothetical protein AOA65_0556 [Candidatus Bathyarchaeota archaeon BA1]|nr:MAG: hypothetical protein AOA65_0556 [Candidatus Bathyarchaeota archaeon BA1]